jgi:hypothetical protein
LNSIRAANCNQVAQAFNPGGLQSFVFLPLHRATVSTSPCLQLETLRSTEGGLLTRLDNHNERIR